MKEETKDVTEGYTERCHV